MTAKNETKQNKNYKLNRKTHNLAQLDTRGTNTTNDTRG